MCRQGGTPHPEELLGHCLKSAGTAGFNWSSARESKSRIRPAELSCLEGGVRMEGACAG